MDKQIEEMAKLEIEESAGYYSAFINDMRISRNKPASKSKTIMIFACPKKYILSAIGIPEGAVVLTREELNDLEYKAYARGVNSFNTLHEKQLSKARKEMAEKFANDISGDILVVNTKEYGRIEVVPLERIDEICKEIIGEKET